MIEYYTFCIILRMSAEYAVDTDNLDSKPFVIRGHHLAVYAELLYHRYKAAEGTADTEVVHEYVKGSISAMVGKSWKRQVQSRLPSVKLERYEGFAYLDDVMGLNPDGIDEFRGKYNEIMLKFLQLPDDVIVNVVVDKPDTLCGACRVGNHCHEVTVSYGFTKDTLVKDEYLGPLKSGTSISLGDLKSRLLEVQTVKEQARRIKSNS